MPFRIDIHSHLLPGVDDGCPTIAESIACARLLVAGGFSHAFCTPHVWPNLPLNNVDRIGALTADLQARFRRHNIPLELLPGGEISISNDQVLSTPPDEIVTMALNGTHVLVDFWAKEWPAYVEPAARRYQSLGLTVILAHPERLELVQRDPPVIERFVEIGLLLQGNLKCLSDPLDSPNRRTVERLLLEGRYEFLASDTHRLDTLPARLDGLGRAHELVGQQRLDQLTIHNPRKLLPNGTSA